MPQEIRFQTKPEIALGQICALVNEDVPRGVVLADAAYGDKNALRGGIETLGLSYAAGIKPSTSLWALATYRFRPWRRAKWDVHHSCYGEMKNISRLGPKNLPYA